MNEERCVPEYLLCDIGTTRRTFMKRILYTIPLNLLRPPRCTESQKYSVSLLAVSLNVVGFLFMLTTTTFDRNRRESYIRGDDVDPRGDQANSWIAPKASVGQSYRPCKMPWTKLNFFLMLGLLGARGRIANI